MITPSLAMIPQAYKSGKVYSQLPVSGDGDFDFTRASSATRVNKDGFIEEVAVNVPRLDYSDGGCPSLLLEPQRTNLIQYSEDFTSGWILDGVTVLSNNAISPDGGLNSDKITFASGNERLYYTISTSSAVFSVYLKGKDGEEVRIRNGNSLIKTNIRLTENWERYEVFIDEANTNIQIENINSEYVYAWGAVLESGSYLTSYIPTNGTTVTRASETATGSGDASTFNDSEGVLYAEIAALADDGTSRYIAISNGSNNERIQIIYNSLSYTISMNVVSSNTVQASVTVITSQTEYNKLAISYKANDVSFWLNGVKKHTDINATMPIGLNVLEFQRPSTQFNFYGNAKDVRVYNTALTDTELQALTTI